MENNNKILEELQDISPLLIQLKDKNPYTISTNYFTDFTDCILDKVVLSNDASFAFNRENPYSVAPAYFESLYTTIVQKINDYEAREDIFAEMEAISPLLNKISKKPVYSVPYDYLNKLELHKNIPVNRQGIVVSFFKTNRVLKFAAAAVITGLLAVGSLWVTQKKAPYMDADTAQTAGVKQLSEEEILNFLKTTAPTENIVTVTKQVNSNNSDIQASLSTVSDKEIQQFLRENGDQDAM